MVRCGVPVCVAGFGQCAAMFASVPPTALSGSTLQITGSSIVTLTPGTTQATYTYSTVGGTGIYTWAAISPAGCGSFATPSIGVFTPIITGQCTIQVQDTSSPTPLIGTFLITIN